MKLGIGLGKGPDAAKAARDAVRQARATCSKPTLALAFGSIGLDQRKVHAALAREVDPRILLGGSSYAEITPAGVTKGSVAVMLADFGTAPRFAESRLRRTSREGGEELARKLVSGPTGGGLPLGLLFTAVVDRRESETIESLTGRLGRFPVFGGMTCGDYDRGMGDPRFTRAWQYVGGELTTAGRASRCSTCRRTASRPRSASSTAGTAWGRSPS